MDGRRFDRQSQTTHNYNLTITFLPDTLTSKFWYLLSTRYVILRHLSKHAEHFIFLGSIELSQIIATECGKPCFLCAERTQEAWKFMFPSLEARQWLLRHCVLLKWHTAHNRNANPRLLQLSLLISPRGSSRLCYSERDHLQKETWKGFNDAGIVESTSPSTSQCLFR